jgi:S1-C subfamily serine protease
VEPPEPPDLPDPEELQGQIEQQFGHPGMWRWRQAFAGGPRLGVQVETLTDQLAAFFGVKGGEGILIQRVRPKSPAEKAGLKAGDVIVRAGDRKLADVDELMEALQETEENSLTLTIVRDRSEKTVPVELDSPERARGARRDRL